MKMQSLATIALSAGLLSQAAAELTWHTDFEAGQKAATEAGKPLLVDFTGSDWCHWCIQLKDEVFSKPEFEAVAEEYVLVELDFPEAEDAITPEQRAKNEALAEKFMVQGFPTVILFDGTGRPYARTGYEAGGPEKYLAHLAEISKPWKTLKTAEGEARKDALVAFLQTLPGEEIEARYNAELEELKKLDPKDESGLITDISNAKKMALFEDGVEQSLQAGDFEKVLAITDAFLEENKPEGEEKQHILMAKVMVYVEQGEKEKAFTLLDEMSALAPESELSRNLDEIKGSITEHLQMRKQMEETTEKVEEAAEADKAEAPKADAPKAEAPKDKETSVIEKAEAAEKERVEVQ